ncbi:hypothetical protein FEM03_15715 [Phragmitibacter flavus]|uniref:Uncharacterized protein n=1 Tax=Phragmitibacter flavus TaxID=2576071 RepID=A0A5R8KBU5_9BACT|nr:hypothetical protein [Phragmitibacter flavus]TLD69771.1 hypothetical protein FEM03_15715 [Phragmitibacter flavus]
MNPHSQELSILKEIIKVYTETTSTTQRCRRLSIIIGCIAPALIILAIAGNVSAILQTRDNLVLAVFGGIACGLSFLYRCAAMQAPYFAKYTTLDAESIRQRIREIESI